MWRLFSRIWFEVHGGVMCSLAVLLCDSVAINVLDVGISWMVFVGAEKLE